MKTFQIIKKNRKYFAAKINNYDCKIVIDEKSESLELGEQTLDVEDISVRTKYGTDLIFKLNYTQEEQKNAGVCTLQTDFFNAELVYQCKKLGGTWDADASAWVFPGFVRNEVEELDEKYNSKKIAVEITVRATIFSDDTGKIFIAGFPIARAFSRDSGAKVAPGVAVMAGGAYSGGSRKNWHGYVATETVLRMEIPELCWDDFENNPKITVKKLEE